MDTLDIIKKYLIDNGYDGLFDAGCCACKIEDLMPCGEMTPNCEPGYIQKCTSECDYFNELTGRCCEEWDYCINKNKPGESV